GIDLVVVRRLIRLENVCKFGQRTARNGPDHVCGGICRLCPCTLDDIPRTHLDHLGLEPGILLEYRQQGVDDRGVMGCIHHHWLVLGMSGKAESGRGDKGSRHRQECTFANIHEILPFRFRTSSGWLDSDPDSILLQSENYAYCGGNGEESRWPIWR